MLTARKTLHPRVSQQQRIASALHDLRDARLIRSWFHAEGGYLVVLDDGGALRFDDVESTLRWLSTAGYDLRFGLQS